MFVKVLITLYQVDVWLEETLNIFVFFRIVSTKTFDGFEFVYTIIMTLIKTKQRWKITWIQSTFRHSRGCRVGEILK